MRSKPRPQIVLKRYSAAEFGISPDLVSAGSRMVVRELQRSGFDAYIVGGAVRDLIVGERPKDFDVATNARPEEIHALFRRSRIIGRRFQLVHVMHGQELIEVSTFRGDQAPRQDGDHFQDESGRILRDNVFGSQEQDARRRDFTANALYYDPVAGEILDYVNGVADIEAGVLRIIGDPVVRYREDPVRMLRAVRFAGKLGFTVDPASQSPIASLAGLLADVPPARIFDEMLKLLLSGHAVDSVHQLREAGLHRGVLPILDVVLSNPLSERFVTLALENTDRRLAQDKPVSPGFLFGALFWHDVLRLWQEGEAAGLKPLPALFDAMERVQESMTDTLAVPKRFGLIMKEIWSLQPRFLQRGGHKPYKLLSHPRFRAGFDFLLLRCESGELDPAIGLWWERFQVAGEEERREMLLPEEAGGTRKKRRRRKKPVEGQTASNDQDGND